MTEQQINELNLNPLMQLISAVYGVPIKDLVSEVQIKKEDIKNEPIVKEEPVSEDSDKLYPLTKDDIKVIVTIIKNIMDEGNKFYDMGIDFWNSHLGITVDDGINLLLSYISDEMSCLQGEIDWETGNVDDITEFFVKRIVNE